MRKDYQKPQSDVVELHLSGNVLGDTSVPTETTPTGPGEPDD